VCRAGIRKQKKHEIKNRSLMKNTKKGFTSSVAIVAIAIAILAINIAPTTVKASGGSGGGGGGGVTITTLSGNWIGSALVTSSTESLGTTAFSLKLSVSSGNITGSAHFGLPVFDSTLKLSAMTLDGLSFSGFVFNGEGSLPISGVMSADGRTIAGTVIEGGLLVTYTVTRN
jgi:hypothetical protein